MLRSCKIIDTGSIVSVFDTDNVPSPLYKEALEYTGGDYQKAIKLWSVTQTELWDEQMDGKESDISLKEVLRFIDNLPLLEESLPKLSPSELQSVRSLMRGLGLVQLADFTTKLNNLFQPNGYFEINQNRLMKSGMYSLEEIEDLDIPKLKDFLARLNIETSVNNFVEPLNSLDGVNLKFKDLSKPKSIIGVYPFSTIGEISQIVADLTDDFSIQGVKIAIADTDYAEGIDSSAFVEKIVNYLSTRKKVIKFYPTAESQTESIINNTIKEGLDTVELEEGLDFLKDILPEVWASKQLEIKNVLKDIENIVKEYNVDIIGITELSQNQQSVIKLLEDTLSMLENPTADSIRQFSNTKDTMIQPISDTVLKTLNNRYKNLTIRSVSTNSTQDELFSNNSLIKIGQELYHQVNRILTKEQLYDEVYNRVVSGDLIIDRKYFNDTNLDLKDPLYKTEVLEIIRRWINSRDIYVSAPINGEEISLYQVLFNHLPIEDINKYQELSGEFSEEYLKTDFVSDFYNHILTEKVNNTDEYNNVLRYFSIGDGDIYFNSPDIVDIAGTKFERQIRDYAKLKKEGQIKEFAIDGDYINEDIRILNNITLANEIEGFEYEVFSDGWLVTKGINPNNYLTQGGQLYKKLYSDLGGSVYGKIVINVSNIYNDLNLDFSYNKSTARDKLEQARKTFSPNKAKNPKVAKEEIKIDPSISLTEYGEVELNNVIQYLLDNGELEYTNEDGIPCAELGMYFNGSNSGKWRIVEDLKGKPPHSRGGVDIEFSEEGVKILRDGGNLKIKAQDGLLIDSDPPLSTYTPTPVKDMYSMSLNQLKTLHPNDIYALQTDYYNRAYRDKIYDHTTVGDFKYILTPTEREKWLQDAENRSGSTLRYYTDIKDIVVPLNSDGTPNFNSDTFYIYPNKPKAPDATTISAWSNSRNTTNANPITLPPAYLHPTTGERLDPNVYISPPEGTQIDVQVSQPYLLNSLRRDVVTQREQDAQAMNLNKELTSKLTQEEIDVIRNRKITPSQYFNEIGISVSDVLSR